MMGPFVQRLVTDFNRNAWMDLQLDRFLVILQLLIRDSQKTLILARQKANPLLHKS